MRSATPSRRWSGYLRVLVGSVALSAETLEQLIRADRGDIRGSRPRSRRDRRGADRGRVHGAERQVPAWSRSDPHPRCRARRRAAASSAQAAATTAPGRRGRAARRPRGRPYRRARERRDRAGRGAPRSRSASRSTTSRAAHQRHRRDRRHDHRHRRADEPARAQRRDRGRARRRAGPWGSPSSPTRSASSPRSHVRQPPTISALIAEIQFETRQGRRVVAESARRTGDGVASVAAHP